MHRIFSIAGFHIFQEFLPWVSSFLGVVSLRLRGMKIGTGTSITTCSASWPHQVQIGRNCILEPGVVFKYDAPYRTGRAILLGDDVFVGRDVEFNITAGIEIGDHSLIAAGVKFIDHNHGTESGILIGKQENLAVPIHVGRDCWIGANAVVLKGFTVGDGAVIGAGAVVARPVPPNEVWCGVPAKRVSSRAPAASGSKVNSYADNGSHS